MAHVSDFHQLSDSLAVWQGYDHGLQSDLFATAIGNQSRVYLIDSVPSCSDGNAGATGSVR